jgi:tetratricopeptide (TPR) repeat protein
MSATALLAWAAGLWAVLMCILWRRDVVYHRRNRARKLGHRGVGHLPAVRPPTRRLVLIALWLGAIYLLEPHLAAWVLAALPLVAWVALAAAARRNLRSGRYEAALNRNRLLLVAAPDSAALHLRRGEILFAAGRLEEAADSLKRALAQTHQRGQEVHALECLARTLIFQGQYDDAVRAVETALKVRPRRSSLHAAQAESLLWQPARPAEALTLITRARDYESKTRHKAGPNCFAAMWAIEAWAFALLGRAGVAQNAFDRARQAIDVSERPEQAGVHLRLGMALRAAGDEKAALHEFEAAVAAEPSGLYGQRAARALAEPQPSAGQTSE